MRSCTAVVPFTRHGYLSLGTQIISSVDLQPPNLIGPISIPITISLSWREFSESKARTSVSVNLIRITRPAPLRLISTWSNAAS